MKDKYVTAVVLAAGRGRRMESDIPKQYLLMKGKEVLYYSLKAFEESDADQVILVTGKEDVSFCRENIVEKYGFSKVRRIIPGGAERYDSVYEGLLASEGSDVVLIHDGARPLVTPEIIRQVIRAAKKHGNCTTGMPVKDTIKRVNGEGFAVDTPDRSSLWAIHTPQGFTYEVIRKAHEAFRRDENPGPVTDDTMLVENYLKLPTKMVMGSYRNMKVTTPEDILLAQALTE